MLVEDDQLNQWIAKEFLLGFGVRIEVAENGKQALDVLEKQSFDIVLMDLQMPEMDDNNRMRLRSKLSVSRISCRD